MDAALYEKLLEELRSDMSRTAPRLRELETVESFLQHRLEVVQDKASYQNVLDDIATDINKQNYVITELQRIDRYVSTQLGKSAFVMETAPAPVPPIPAREPAAKQPPTKLPPAKKPDFKPLVKDDDTRDEPPARGKISEMPAASSGMTIEFGPDGFPINSGPGKGKTDRNSSKATVPESAGMDGATINFGPDGFPLDIPKSGPKKK